MVCPAHAENLAQSPEWIALVHYRPALFHTWKSTIDSDTFFIHPDGKTNPDLELKATIQLFNEPGKTEQKCLFPARWLFLKKNNIDVKPFPDCSDFVQFKKDLNPADITLLYTDAYMNNPASLFGHTLLRIDIPEGKTQLVAHGANFGAFTGKDENGLKFAIYGLFGGYYGGWTVKPYYDIINMYNNIENRDIWEFTLNLTPDERDFFVAHLWEIGHTQTRYFFFTENCSYMIMEMFDAIRPTLKMADDFPVQAIPLDTLKSVNHRTDLVKKINYRPSRQKRISVKYDPMTPAEKRALLAYLDGDDTLVRQLDKQAQADIYDTAYEFIQYQLVAGKMELPEYRKKSFQTLLNRRDLPAAKPYHPVTPASPLSAHESARFTLQQGFERGHSFQEIEFRPAYHSLTDPQNGFLNGSEINFFKTALRYHDQTHDVHLQKLDFVNIISISPWNALFHPFSYTIRTGINREWNPKTNEYGLIYDFSGGSGLTTEIGKHTYMYVFGKTSFQYGGGFMPHNQAIGIGGQIGLLNYFGSMQTELSVEKLFSYNWFLNQLNIHARGVYNITQNTAAFIDYQIRDIKPHSTNTVMAGFMYYF